MMQAIRLTRTIRKSGELHLTNLSVVEGQHVELLLLFSPTALRTYATIREAGLKITDRIE